MSDALHPAVAGAQPSQRAEKNPDAPLFEGAYQERFDNILTRYPERRAALLPALHMAQELRGWIAPDTIPWEDPTWFGIEHVRRVIQSQVLSVGP